MFSAVGIGLKEKNIYEKTFEHHHVDLLLLNVHIGGGGAELLLHSVPVHDYHR